MSNNPTEEGYRGERFKNHTVDIRNATDLLVLTQPQLISGIHQQYLEAGADIIETDTFNANLVSMEEFELSHLTYEINNFADVRADFAKDGLPVMALVELVSSAPREKVVRVALAALRNLATCSADINPEPDTPRIDSKVFLGEMIACGLMKAIGLLQDRQFTDPDIADDVQGYDSMGGIPERS